MLISLPHKVLAICFLLAWAASAAHALPVPDHVVIVIEENRSDDQVYGDPTFPYLNSLLPNAAKFTNYGGITHPSQPNYLALFSGDTQGVTDNNVHAFSEFSAATNLGAKLLSSGRTFTGYSEDLPAVGAQDETYANYVRRHVPWTNWQDASIAAANRLPDSVNRPFAGDGNWPATDFSQLPDVSIVIPDLIDDGHDTSDDTADTWLHDNIGPYLTWANSHNSLLIVTWDEDEGSGKIPTFFAGPMVQSGEYDESINHYNTLRTLEDMYSLSHDTANTQTASSIENIWLPEPTNTTLFGAVVMMMCGARMRAASVNLCKAADGIGGLTRHRRCHRRLYTVKTKRAHQIGPLGNIGPSNPLEGIFCRGRDLRFFRRAKIFSAICDACF